MAKSLGLKVIGASLWLTGGRVLSRCLDIISLLILTRLLSPAEFGIVALAASLTAVLETATEMSLSSALIGLGEVEKPQLDTAFTMNVLRGLLLTSLCAALAWPFASLYDDPRLVTIVLLLSCGPLVRSLTSPALALLLRELKFSQSFFIDLSGRLSALVISVVLALMGFGYWAIAFGSVAAPAVTSVLSYRYAPYRPRLSLQHFRTLWNFAGWMSVAQIFSAMNWQFDRFFLGRFVSARQLGFYQVSSTIATIPEQTAVIAVVAPLLSAFVKMKENTRQLAAAYRQADHAVFAMGGGALLMIAIFSAPIIRLGFAPNWQPMQPLLQLMALAYIPALMRIPFRALCMSQGRTRLLAGVMLTSTTLKVISISTGFFLDGIMGALAGIAVASTLSAFVYMRAAAGLMSLSVQEQVLALWRPPVAAIPAVAFGLAVVHATASYSGILLGIFTAAGLAGTAALYVLGLLATWHMSGRPPSIEQRLLRLVVKPALT